MGWYDTADRGMRAAAGPTRDNEYRPDEAAIRERAALERARYERQRQEAQAAADAQMHPENNARAEALSYMFGQPYPNDTLEERMSPPRTYSPQPNGDYPDTRGWNSDQKYNNPMTDDENMSYYAGKVPGMTTLAGAMNGLAKNATGTGEGEQMSSGIMEMRARQKDLERKKNTPFTVSGRRPRQ